MVEAAIVGLGRWGQRLVTSVQGSSTRIRFRSCFVRNPEPARGFAAAHGLRMMADFESLLRDDAIDAVVLATPHSLHAAQVVAAARAGKAVFCEKPLALTAADARAALAACERSDVVLGVGQDKRFWPSMQRLAQAVREGALGDLLHVEGHFSNEVARDFPSAWRASGAEAPAGPLTATAIHLLDAFVRMAGPVRSASARLLVPPGAGAAYNALTATLEFDGGLAGVLSSVRATPAFWRVHVFGSQGSAEARGAERLLLLCSGAPAQELVFEPVDTVKLALEAFADAVEGRAPYPITPAEMVATAAGLEAITRSVALGRPVACE